MTETDLLIELYKDLKRQGPGSDIQTAKALLLTNLDLNSPLQIADIGCGTGAHTMVLAKNTKGIISAVDNVPEFLLKLRQNTQRYNLKDRVITLLNSMEDLPFSKETFDLVWSEGAIYIMGFEKGIQYWRNYLKDDGVIAISEVSWLTDERPQEIEAYWEAAYPEIDTTANKLKILEKNGYSSIEHFTLPVECWTKYYFDPLEKVIPHFKEKYGSQPMVKEFIAETLNEIHLFNKFKKYYGFVFYIAKKTV